ncbi:hypothetical protein R1flu_016539 [Riccia fluitans]|uniref:Ubiquitin-like protease family profile domain-containing protein n=1 Tax=Riccia fluitans TaxID=41844 RepID=A0ABD1YMN5_9MARC
MNARVALMERKDLYDLLEAKMEGFQIANHPETIGGFENLNLTITKKWVEIPTLNLEEFEKCPTDFPDELVARYDKTNHTEEAIIKLTRLRKSICPKFHDEDMQENLPTWIFVPIHSKNHWSLAIIRIHNDECMLGHLDSFRGIHDPEAIFHVLRTFLPLIVPIDLALIMTGIMDVEQQQDGHSCGKHVLQMLVGAAKKESDGLDRCFREEGLIRYIATLDQVISFDVVLGMYLSGKMAGPPM